MDELRKKFTIMIVTHSMNQAKRISDKTAFFWMGKLIEHGETSQVFNQPNDKRTQGYVSGEFG